MANRRLSMRKIKEVLRLSYQGGFSTRQVAHSLNISRISAAARSNNIRSGPRKLGWPGPYPTL